MKRNHILAVLLCGLLCCLAGCDAAENAEGDVISGGSVEASDSAAGDDSAREDDSAADHKTDSAAGKDTAGESKADSESGDSAASDSTGKTESQESQPSAENSTAQGGNTPGDAATESEVQSGNTAGTSAGGNTTTKAASAGNTTKTTTTAPKTTAAATTTAATDAEVKEIKTITLGSTIEATGEGIAVRGGRVGITKGGTYWITGSLSDGQIEINTTKKVVLQLAGMSLTNPSGSAINAIDAKKLTIELVDGTVNSLSDGGTHDTDKGTIFSNDTVILQGNGTLNLTAVYAHGIASDDDILMYGGNVHITSAKSGLFANDLIQVDGGTLYCDAGTNGIKSKGDVLLNDGSCTLLGGTKEEKGAVIALGTFTINGGSLLAIGNTFTLPADTSAQNVLVAKYGTSQAANAKAKFTFGSSLVAELSSPRAYTMFLYSGPEITQGAAYSLYSGSTKLGDLTASGRVSTFTAG